MAIEPCGVSLSGTVISSGACEAICAIALWAEATVTRPAPARRAANPDMAGAPVFPREPPTTRTWPKVPLCPSRGLGASSSRNIRGSTTDSHASSYSDSGLPIGPTCSSPAWLQFGGSTSAGLGAVNVMVQSARANSPTGCGESLGIPEGISTAATFANGNPWLIARMPSSITPAAGPLMPVPSSASITSVAQRASAGMACSTGHPHAWSMR